MAYWPSTSIVDESTKAIRRRGGHPRPAPMQGRPPTATAPCKGAAGFGQGQPAREASTARRGSSPQGRPAPLVGVAARKGGACRHDRLRPARRGGYRLRAHPLVSRLPQRGPIVGCPQRAAASEQGQPLPAQGQQRR
ncbi:hypothetical protein BHE74_00018367 [Ensete ventricosum]|nr:hypothetical protein GW17_00021167 [Ensete ventricosum]RWW73725.1 hypothetical protein BHE74_00018367 [Ensete ventricosum]